MVNDVGALADPLEAELEEGRLRGGVGELDVAVDVLPALRHGLAGYAGHQAPKALAAVAVGRVQTSEVAPFS